MRFFYFLETAIAFLSSLNAIAAVKFNCYENPNMGVVAYQVANANCKPGSANGSIDSTKTTLCTYNALCEVLGANEKPTQLTKEDVEHYSRNLYINNSAFKASIVSCSGGSGIDPKSKLAAPNCPAIKNCKDDIAFDGVPAMVDGRSINFGPSRSTEQVEINSPNFNKAGAK